MLFEFYSYYCVIRFNFFISFEYYNCLLLFRMIEFKKQYSKCIGKAQP